MCRSGGPRGSTSGPDRSAVSDLGPTASASGVRRLVKALVYAAIGAAWAFVCYIQVVLVASRLLTNPAERWLPWNQIAGTILVYLPVALAAIAWWLTRRKPLGMVVLTHSVAACISVLFWFT